MTTLEEKYVQKWKELSLLHKQNGDYAWMNSFLTNYQNVLELGCGSGYSTLELVKDGHHVYSVDVIAGCLSNAEALLKENGKASCVADLKNGCSFSEDAVFAQCDILHKDSRDALSAIPADIVVMTNSGTQKVSVSAESVSSFLKMGYAVEDMGNLFLYREALIKAASEIAVKGKKPFFLVDRFPKEGVNFDYLKQLEKAGLVLVKYEERKISLPLRRNEKNRAPEDTDVCQFVMAAALFDSK